MSFQQYKEGRSCQPWRQLKAGSEIKYLGLTLLTSCSNWSLILCAVANSVHFNRRRTWSTGPPLKWTPFNTQIKNLWTHKYKTFQDTNTKPFETQIQNATTNKCKYVNAQIQNLSTHTNKKPFSKNIQNLSTQEQIIFQHTNKNPSTHIFFWAQRICKTL